MRILEITTQNRRDFRAIYECEHCGEKKEGYGYDDNYFHMTVIPGMECNKCGKKSDESYSPLQPKYDEGLQV